MRKKVDDRIRFLIENGVKNRHRSIFLIIGDKSHDQIVNLRYLCEKVGMNPSRGVLWCYKEKLELSSNKEKRKKQIKRAMQSGMLDPERADPFLLFLETAKITYCMYKESKRILGNTFSMCILQDFEALTPNILARTIETVEGGGLILLLIRSLPTLTSLYTMTMDVHLRFRTGPHVEAAPRFNERFLLSLASCKACIVVDDELNILPISSNVRSIVPITDKKDSEGLSAEKSLKEVKEQLNDDFPAGPLLKICSTWDQGRAVIGFLDAIFDKMLKRTVALLAARGRGKSAALGLAVAGAVAAGYSNIFVTAPSPENLKTLFEFVCTGLNALEYKEHIDYTLVKSTSLQLKKTTIQINICKDSDLRQTIQYIQPQEHERLSLVDLLIIDEAAAIPLPVVKSLFGPYLVFLSSTVNGYEGTGHSLSLKLLQQLEDQNLIPAKSNDCKPGGSFMKIKLKDSIRYANGDPVEMWLNSLLCLDVADSLPPIRSLPLADECDLYYVNRDTLFSFHKESELFLKRVMALFVASHYKISPDDLQLLADAPTYHLFVLLGPGDDSTNPIPDILCVLQVCLEGEISRESALRSLSKDRKSYGDQIPWKICEQYRNASFASLSGARIVRIATNPNVMKLGYGSKAVELLARYYEGDFTTTSEMDRVSNEEPTCARSIDTLEKVLLLEENIESRTELPPLLVYVCDRKPEPLDYIGASFGLTLDLFRFWRKQKFIPFYICQTPDKVTDEHRCMVLRKLHTVDNEVGVSKEFDFFTTYCQEFKQIFLNLLSASLSRMEYKLTMTILDPKVSFTETESSKSSANGVFQALISRTPWFMERLEAYANDSAEFFSIADIEHPLALLYFKGRLPVPLSYDEASLLLCKCIQRKDFSFIEKEMKLERHQMLSVFMNVMKKFCKYLRSLECGQVVPGHPEQKDEEMKDKVEGTVGPEHIPNAKEADFEGVLRVIGDRISPSGLVNMKSIKNKLKKKGKRKRVCERHGSKVSKKHRT